MATTQPKTPDQVRAELYERGITLKQWAQINGYPVPEVYKIMSGERKGLYGRGHEIAVKLGLKIPLDPNNI
ncbi:DNA-binding protein [Psychrobacter lutiphocae]|uniref:DNA-binding protein n=1 Tax=Psychrobacter lutiphocae TaxID=540500 RepID=UPI00037DFA7B|nr:DNA-binding protein [Psychrobacter lutiphocae]